PDDLLGSFKNLTDTLIKEISPHFNNVEMIRIHGDCHFSNLIYRPDEFFYIIDFDDMVVGPPVQDFWMLLPGYREESLAEIEIFLEGYEMFRDFDRSSLRLIEPLRAMRYIHYTAWCAYQFAEDGETRVDSDFGSRQYWQIEMDDLADQLKKIKEQEF
ncbi:MAG: phosphotransferase, partial [Deltaproteobacteria bacterium]